jgi:Smg protein
MHKPPHLIEKQHFLRINIMFEVLVYMFENYIDTQFRPDQDTLSKELSAAGFAEYDINSAFNWFNELERMTEQGDIYSKAQSHSTRIFTEDERRKISAESLGLVVFLTQANILNTAQRELVLDLAMNLSQLKINIEEMRWIVLMTTWGAGKTGADKTRDYLFIEDALNQTEKPTLH